MKADVRLPAPAAQAGGRVFQAVRRQRQQHPLLPALARRGGHADQIAARRPGLGVDGEQQIVGKLGLAALIDAHEPAARFGVVGEILHPIGRVSGADEILAVEGGGAFTVRRRL
ncbi:hypothetical protein D3C73_834190 [compost metagenome]